MHRDTDKRNKYDLLRAFVLESFLCRGINASGTCQESHIDTTATDSSTNPVTSNAVFDALALKQAVGSYQASDADLDDLADGTLSGSKIGSGIPSSNLSGAVATALLNLSTTQPSITGNCAGQVVVDVDPATGALTCEADDSGAGGSESNTYKSTKTFENTVLFSTGHGISMGLGTATGAPCGLIHYASSDTVLSTRTVGTTLNILSTYTVVANTLVSFGERLVVECAFQTTSVAPGTPVAGTYFNVNTPIGTQAAATASAIIVVESVGTLATSTQMNWNTTAFSQVANATALVSVTAGYGVQRQLFTPSNANTVKCAASRASGGTINFVYMRVSKRC
jgi:hypothetical protein